MKLLVADGSGYVSSMEDTECGERGHEQFCLQAASTPAKASWCKQGRRA